MAAEPLAIDVRGIAKTYGQRVALDDLTLQVRPGEVVAVLGPNGAGKTTTFRILAGLISATRGSGSVAGVPLNGVSGQRLRTRVGLLTEVPGLWERLSVRANLLVHARLHGVADAAGRVAALLDRFDLSSRGEDRAGALSKGLKQRVALARALVAEPAVLLLDEPTSGLDPAAARTVRDVVREAQGRGVAVLLATHQLDEAEALADRIAVLQRRIVAVDSPEGLRRRLAGPPRLVVDIDGGAAAWTATLGAIATSASAADMQLHAALAEGHDVPEAVAALVSAGARVRGVRVERASLEDAYLALVQRDA